MSPETPRLPQPRRRPSSDANAATYAALMGLILLGFGFLGMVSLVLPQVRGLVLVLFGGAAFFAIHYVLWGRLLNRIRDEDREAEESRAESGRRDGR
ncbi:MAG: hypothetical protein AB7U20_15600 [Planctomycetaceae bacterium]